MQNHYILIGSTSLIIGSGTILFKSLQCSSQTQTNLNQFICNHDSLITRDMIFYSMISSYLSMIILHSYPLSQPNILALSLPLFSILSILPFSNIQPLITISLVLMVFIRTSFFSLFYQPLLQNIPTNLIPHLPIIIFFPIPIFSIFPTHFGLIFILSTIGNLIYQYHKNQFQQQQQEPDQIPTDNNNFIASLVCLVINDITYHLISIDNKQNHNLISIVALSMIPFLPALQTLNICLLLFPMIVSIPQLAIIVTDLINILCLVQYSNPSSIVLLYNISHLIAKPAFPFLKTQHLQIVAIMHLLLFLINWQLIKPAKQEPTDPNSNQQFDNKEIQNQNHLNN